LTFSPWLRKGYLSVFKSKVYMSILNLERGKQKIMDSWIFKTEHVKK